MNLSEPIIFERRCDASGGIALTADKWVGANDEDNVLQLYTSLGGAPLEETFVNLDDFLQVTGPDDMEVDIESATRIGDIIWWIGSHSQSRTGKTRLNRHRLFATTVETNGGSPTVVPLGTPCTTLRDVIIEDARLAPFNLGDAALRPPKEPGFNIESLCAHPNGSSLWVGLRAPIPAMGALLLPLEDLDTLLGDGTPTLGTHELVDLRGLGFRDMIWMNGRYLILAGDFRDRADPLSRASMLFLWDGPGSQPAPLQLDFGTINPEALIQFSDGRILIVSDDGTMPCQNGLQCKDENTPTESRRFRALWLTGLNPLT